MNRCGLYIFLVGIELHVSRATSSATLLDGFETLLLKIGYDAWNALAGAQRSQVWEPTPIMHIIYPAKEFFHQYSAGSPPYAAFPELVGGETTNWCLESTWSFYNAWFVCPWRHRQNEGGGSAAHNRNPTIIVVVVWLWRWININQRTRGVLVPLVDGCQPLGLSSDASAWLVDDGSDRFVSSMVFKFISLCPRSSFL